MKVCFMKTERFKKFLNSDPQFRHFIREESVTNQEGKKVSHKLLQID